MIKKYSVLIAVVFSLILMIIAISIYPGGSMFDKNSIGFDWTKNFMSNLFALKALNGSENPSRIWAYLRMILLSTWLCNIFQQAIQIPLRGGTSVTEAFEIIMGK